MVHPVFCHWALFEWAKSFAARDQIQNDFTFCKASQVFLQQAICKINEFQFFRNKVYINFHCFMRLFQKKTKHWRGLVEDMEFPGGIKEMAYAWNFQGLIKWKFQGWPRKNNDVEFPGAGVLIFGLGISNRSNTLLCGISRGVEICFVWNFQG